VSEYRNAGYDGLYDVVRDLVMCHSPSGVEQEVDEFLKTRFGAFGIDTQVDASGNLIARIPGRGEGRLAITAHKDEIGAIVTSVENGGKLKVRKLGGSFPWIYGEGVFDILGARQTINGILSFGSRHISHASPQFAHKETAPVRWADAWIETKLSADELAAAGVGPGSRAVIGKHRKAPIRLRDHIASYTLDNKASLAVLLELAARVKDPVPHVYLVASAKEEVGALGAQYFTQWQHMDALIALEICPLASEYQIVDGPDPVLLAADGHGIYDIALNAAIDEAASRCGITLQKAVVSGFGSDASLTMKAGKVAKAACLGFPTLNTHGFEVAHLGAIAHCVDVLEAVCGQALP
jgi:putative aminopeptidase FrvX